MKFIDNSADGKIVAYRDCDGVQCFSRSKHSSVQQFIDWCKEYGVTKVSDFYDFKLLDE